MYSKGVHLLWAYSRGLKVILTLGHISVDIFLIKSNIFMLQIQTIGYFNENAISH